MQSPFRGCPQNASDPRLLTLTASPWGIRMIAGSDSRPCATARPAFQSTRVDTLRRAPYTIGLTRTCVASATLTRTRVPAGANSVSDSAS